MTFLKITKLITKSFRNPLLKPSEDKWQCGERKRGKEEKERGERERDHAYRIRHLPYTGPPVWSLHHIRSASMTEPGIPLSTIKYVLQTKTSKADQGQLPGNKIRCNENISRAINIFQVDHFHSDLLGHCCSQKLLPSISQKCYAFPGSVTNTNILRNSEMLKKSSLVRNKT